MYAGGVTTSEDDPRQPFAQIADELRSEIAAGTLRAGQKLPPIRQLSERFRHSPNTVQSALRVLRDEGFITTTPNRGSFVMLGTAREGGAAAQSDRQQSDLTSLSEKVERLQDRLESLERRIEEH